MSVKPFFSENFNTYIHIFILSIKYQIFNCTYHGSFSCYLTLNVNIYGYGAVQCVFYMCFIFQFAATATSINSDYRTLQYLYSNTSHVGLCLTVS